MARVQVEIDGLTWKKCDCCGRYVGKHRCEFCDKAYRTPNGLAKHKAICYCNPDRECPLCHGEGGYGVPAIGPNLGVIFDAEWEDCPACEKAKERQAAPRWSFDPPRITP
jgi:hypothetical protein